MTKLYRCLFAVPLRQAAATEAIGLLAISDMVEKTQGIFKIARDCFVDASGAAKAAKAGASSQ